MEGGKGGGKEGRRDGGREGGREGRREGRREGGREGEREREVGEGGRVVWRGWAGGKIVIERSVTCVVHYSGKG